MKSFHTIDTELSFPDARARFKYQEPSPGILIAHTPESAAGVDRCLIGDALTVGRGGLCDLTIKDSKLSSRHFCVNWDGADIAISDLGSTNGTFVDGLPVHGRTRISDRAVIRAGQSVFVVVKDASERMITPPAERFGIAGRFHTGSLLGQLQEATLSARHILLSGDTGTGKELAARAFAAMLGKPGAPKEMLVYNAARFASREEAVSSLFGVVARFFSGVDPRAGMIEQVKDGVLFIDEVHNLPEESQRMLLRVVEDGKTSRLGESYPRDVDAHFVFASNVDGPTRGLARDLFARLRCIELPGLNARIEDVPAIFNVILKTTLAQHSIDFDEVKDLFTADYYEALCLTDYSQSNVRTLVDIADRLVTRAVYSGRFDEAVAEVFGEQFHDGLVARRGRAVPTGKERSHYEQNKSLIIATYRKYGNNLSATERRLKSEGLLCSRQWLAKFLEKWNER